MADIPLEPGHPSRAPLDAVAARLGELADVPALVLWGPRDPVFTDRYLRDLLHRLPHAVVHRYPRRLAPGHRGCAGDRPAHLAVGRAAAPRPPWAGREPAPGGAPSVCGPSWTAAPGTPLPRWSNGAAAVGGSPSGRCSGGCPNSPPGSPRPACAPAIGSRCSCHRAPTSPPRSTPAGGPARSSWSPTPDSGLRGLARALRAAGPTHVIGVPRGLAAGPGARRARTTDRRRAGDRGDPPAARRGPRAGRARAGWAGRLEAAARSRAGRGVRGRVHLRRHRTGQGRGVPAPPGPRPAGDPARRLRADRPRTGSSRRSPRSRSTDRRLGIASVVPDIEAPGRLTATALAEAVDAAAATVVFASPAALRNVVATADALGTAAPRGAGSGAARGLRRGARSGRAAARAARGAARRAAAHPVRHDRGAAGHRRHAGRDRRRRHRQRGVRRVGRCPASTSGSARSTATARPPAR